MVWKKRLNDEVSAWVILRERAMFPYGVEEEAE